jgi:DNA-binding winged helix-turn-helix (wHTH) protein
VPGIIAFQDFELDELRFELRRGGELVHVQPKVLRLLFYLARHRQRSVSTQELLDALWPGERVTVASIKRAVGGARRALGESAESQVSIRTVRSHGYQFVRDLTASRHSEPVLPPLSAAQPNGGFVGRQRVLAELEQRLARARAGVGQLVLVSGEPGIGKSRLLQELRQRAAESGAHAWLARCTHDEGAPALWPFLQLLRAAMSELGPERVLSVQRPCPSCASSIRSCLRHHRSTRPRSAFACSTACAPFLSARRSSVACVCC